MQNPTNGICMFTRQIPLFFIMKGKTMNYIGNSSYYRHDRGFQFYSLQSNDPQKGYIIELRCGTKWQRKSLNERQISDRGILVASGKSGEQNCRHLALRA